MDGRAIAPTAADAPVAASRTSDEELAPGGRPVPPSLEQLWDRDTSDIRGIDGIVAGVIGEALETSVRSLPAIESE